MIHPKFLQVLFGFFVVWACSFFFRPSAASACVLIGLMVSYILIVYLQMYGARDHLGAEIDNLKTEIHGINRKVDSLMLHKGLGNR